MNILNKCGNENLVLNKLCFIIGKFQLLLDKKNSIYLNYSIFYNYYDIYLHQIIENIMKWNKVKS